MFEGIKNRDLGGGKREKMKRRDSDQNSGGGTKRGHRGTILGVLYELVHWTASPKEVFAESESWLPVWYPGCAGLGPGEVGPPNLRGEGCQDQLSGS